MDTGAAAGGPEAIFIQLLPLFFWGLIFAIPIYKTATKRGVNPWIWVILGLVPVVNMIAIPAFWITTIMDILDRLNGKSSPASAFD